MARHEAVSQVRNASAEIARRLDPPKGAAAPSPDTLAAVYGLTKAETALFQMIAEGASIAEAAARRQVSLATVKTQLRHLFHKTETRRQADLVRLANTVGRLPSARP